MTLVDINNSIPSIRELLKDEISEKAKFLSGDMGVPYKNEKILPVFHIVKEEKFILKILKKKIILLKILGSKKEQEKLQIQSEKFPKIINYGSETNSNKSVKSEKEIEPMENLSKLRKDLSLNNNKVFSKDSCQINIDDEDNLTITDVEIGGTINIV